MIPIILPSQMLVAGFSAYTDIERAHEIANEVRRVSKQLKEAQGLAQLYNNRERLFGSPITNVSVHSSPLAPGYPTANQSLLHPHSLILTLSADWPEL